MLNYLIEKFVPESKAPTRMANHNPYVNSNVLSSIKEKRKKWLKFKYCHTASNHRNYKMSRNHVVSELRLAKYQYEKGLAAKIKHDSKLFWKYVRSKTKTLTKVSKLETTDGSLTEKDEETANVLNQYFSSVFEEEGPTDQLEIPERQFGEPLVDVEINESKVMTVINPLNPSKSQGPDQLHPCLLKETKHQLITPLTMLFMKSIEEAVIPESWKQANVSAIFKKGDRKKPENYRPISLTSVPGKMLEKIIRDALVKHMSSNDLFSDVQHGFISGKSCVTQLLEYMEDLTEAVDSGCDVDVIYLDFCKAFDKVPHKRLLMKLYAYGVRGRLYRWIREFLKDRQQRVVVCGSASDWQSVTSGIPQGSVLGPILFLIFINDLPDAINCCIKLFADDAKIYAQVNSIEQGKDLQGNIKRAEEWASTWEMFFNEKKMQTITYRNKRYGNQL